MEGPDRQMRRSERLLGRERRVLQPSRIASYPPSARPDHVLQGQQPDAPPQEPESFLSLTPSHLLTSSGSCGRAEDELFANRLPTPDSSEKGLSHSAIRPHNHRLPSLPDLRKRPADFNLLPPTLKRAHSSSSSHMTPPSDQPISTSFVSQPTFRHPQTLDPGHQKSYDFHPTVQAQQNSFSGHNTFRQEQQPPPANLTAAQHQRHYHPRKQLHSSKPRPLRRSFTQAQPQTRPHPLRQVTSPPVEPLCLLPTPEDDTDDEGPPSPSPGAYKKDGKPLPRTSLHNLPSRPAIQPRAALVSARHPPQFLQLPLSPSLTTQHSSLSPSTQPLLTRSHSADVLKSPHGKPTRKTCLDIITARQLLAHGRAKYQHHVPVQSPEQARAKLSSVPLNAERLLRMMVVGKSLVGGWQDEIKVVKTAMAEREATKMDNRADFEVEKENSRLEWTDEQVEGEQDAGLEIDEDDDTPRSPLGSGIMFEAGVGL